MNKHQYANIARFVSLGQRGFTLIELMVVIAIVAVLSSIAYPSYLGYIKTAHQADGIAMITKIKTAQDEYFIEELSYETDLTLLGFSFSGYNNSDDNYYRVRAEACEGLEPTVCVNIVAEPLDNAGAPVVGGDELSLSTQGVKEGPWPD